MTETIPDWDLAYVMPNLQLGYSCEFEEIAFVPANDSRLVQIASKNKAARVLLEGFSDQSGKA